MWLSRSNPVPRRFRCGHCWQPAAFLLLAHAGFSTMIVFVNDYFAASFRTPAEVFEILGSPVLASLPAVRETGRDLEES